MQIGTPTLHHFFRDSSTQIIQDFPDSTNLKTCILTHTISESQANLLGSALGSWTRTFHTWGASPESTNLRDTMGRNSNAVDLKFALNAGRLILTADAFPNILDKSRDMFREIAAGLRSRSHKDNLKEKSLIHGDFWTGKYGVLFAAVLSKLDDFLAYRLHYKHSPSRFSHQCRFHTTIQTPKASYCRLGVVSSQHTKLRPRPVLRGAVPSQAIS